MHIQSLLLSRINHGQSNLQKYVYRKYVSEMAYRNSYLAYTVFKSEKGELCRKKKAVGIERKSKRREGEKIYLG